MSKRFGLIAIAILAVAGFAGTAYGAGPSVTLKADFFFPSDKLFRETYSGGPSFGADIMVPLGGVFQLWAGGEFFGRTGLLSLSEETTKVRIVPLYAGLRAQFGAKGVRPYIGAAAAYFFLHEENPLGTADDGGLGLLSQSRSPVQAERRVRPRYLRRLSRLHRAVRRQRPSRSQARRLLRRPRPGLPVLIDRERILRSDHQSGGASRSRLLGNIRFKLTLK